MRNASTCAALFEEDHAISFGIEEATIVGNQARAWSTMKKHDGLAVRIPALLVIKLVHIGDAEVAAVVRFDLGIKCSACLHIVRIIAAECVRLQTRGVSSRKDAKKAKDAKKTLKPSLRPLLSLRLCAKNYPRVSLDFLQ